MSRTRLGNPPKPTRGRREPVVIPTQEQQTWKSGSAVRFRPISLNKTHPHPPEYIMSAPALVFTACEVL